MQDYGTVVEAVEQTVYHVDYGLYLKTSMEAIIYQLPRPVLVITRSILMHNATAAIGSYTVISGDTLGAWKQSMEENDSMLWKPLPPRGSGLDPNWKN